MYICIHKAQRKMKLSMLSLFLIYIWGYETVFSYFFVVFGKTPYIGEAMKPLPSLIFVFLLCISIFRIIQSIKVSDLIVYLIIISSSLVLVIFDTTELWGFYEIYEKFLFFSFPMYFVGLTLYREIGTVSKTSVGNIFYWISRVSILSIIFLTIITGSTIIAEWSNDQYHAYLMLPHLLMVCGLLYKKFNIFDFSLVVSGCLFIIMTGCRGAMVCMFVFIIFQSYEKIKELKLIWKVIIYFTLLLAIMFILSDYFITFVQFINDFAKDQNMSTRFTQTLLTGSISDSGRSDIQKILFEQIRLNPFGNGITSSWNYVGVYSHNFIIDMILEYGVIIGSVFIFILGRLFVIANKKTKFLFVNHTLLLVLFCTGFMKLMFSGTYLTEPYFYLLIGFCVAIKRSNITSV